MAWCVAGAVVGSSVVWADTPTTPPATDQPPPAAPPATAEPTTPPAPIAPPAPASAPQPTAAPATPVDGVVRSSNDRTVDRHGLVVLGGIIASDTSTLPRLDVILPVPLPGAPQLRFGLSLGYDHTSASAPDGTAADSYGGAIYPTVYYDWRLPIQTSAGDFVGSVEGGFGLAIDRLKIDEPFVPGTYKTLTAIAFRAAGSIQFRAHNGFVVSVQPLGIEVPVTTPDSPDPKFMVTASTQWEGALLCGYQFQ